MVVTGQQTQETLERWVFDVHTDKSVGTEGKVEKSQKEITSEIQAIIRQITASVTFLPLLDEPCTFDLLVYTDNDVDVPQVDRLSRPRPRPLCLPLAPRTPTTPHCPAQAWEESDPKYIANSDEVKLRSFTTKVHRVDACVSCARPATAEPHPLCCPSPFTGLASSTASSTSRERADRAAATRPTLERASMLRLTPHAGICWRRRLRCSSASPRTARRWTANSGPVCACCNRDLYFTADPTART